MAPLLAGRRTNVDWRCRRAIDAQALLKPRRASGSPGLVAGAGDTASLRLDRGILVAFEGIDGAGKTTQAELLGRHLRQAGLTVVQTKEPTSVPHGQRLRASAATGRLGKDEELQAFLDDRRDHVRTLIAPALGRGEVVIVDRYYFSTAAYQS